MSHLWILTALVALFGLGNGAIATATPQAGIALGLSNELIGLIGAAIPLGYGLSCLAFGQLFRRIPGKFVVLGGLLVSGLSMAVMSRAQTAAVCIGAQFTYGVASGAFWPFASAWMLDFQGPGITKTRVLRHYNMGWTSGCALGMYLAGISCRQRYIFEVFTCSAALIGGLILLALFPRTTHPVAEPAEHAPASGGNTGRRLVWTLFVAALLANLLALGVRAVLMVNYAKLNDFLQFPADRMGLFGAASIAGQAAAFGAGHLYEPYLGLRRTYIVTACAMMLVCLTFAFTSSLALLLLASLLCGIALAMSFQTSILACTSFFRAPRTGTTVHEAIVGLGGVASVAGGALVGWAYAQNWTDLDALRLPLCAMAGIILATLLFSLVLMGLRGGERRLLPHPPTPQPVKLEAVEA